jgi:hypothetical protein
LFRLAGRNPPVLKFKVENRRVPARQPTSFSLNRKENEARETLFYFYRRLAALA